ncbi:MAG: hypothetical protein ABSE43_06775 [Steroidobacteraceae bacterium]
MPKIIRALLFGIGTAAALSACGNAVTPSPAKAGEIDVLVGAWRSHLQVNSGAFAGMQGLEFMYVFNFGGTMTESSNYDASPPVQPAYGVWRKTGAREFEARYEFYNTKPPAAFGEIVKGGGWAPDGYGLFVENIKLSEDGQSFTSSMTYTMYDNTGKPTDASGGATGAGTRIGF